MKYDRFSPTMAINKIWEFVLSKALTEKVIYFGNQQ